MEYFIVKSNNDMVEAMKDVSIDEIGVTETIKTALKFRLSCIRPYTSNWSQAMSLGALPQNVPHTVANIGTMADDIWFLAGDASTDANWYTKRGLISGVYVATELFMLTDTSKDNEATW